jgi:YD repeat-containing protein
MLDRRATYYSDLRAIIYWPPDLIAAEFNQASAAILRQTLAWSMDAYSSGRGIPLVFSRVAYDSLHQRFTPASFGRGWSHNYEVALTHPEPGYIIINGPGGSGRAFTLDLTGDWQPQAGDHGALTELPGGDFSLKEKNGLLWRFAGTDGRLLSISEPNGNQLTFAYNGQGQLNTVSHSNGQSFTLGYNPSDRITSLTDHAGRVTTYNFDASGELLLSVVAPGGVTTEYSYLPASGGNIDHALQTVTFPNGSHRYFSYDSEGRLSAQWRDENVDALSYAYDTLGRVSIQDADAATTTLDLGERGQVLQVSDPLDRHDNFQYDDDQNLSELIQPAGGMYRLDYDSAGNPTQVQEPSGETLEMASTTDFNRLDWLNDQRDNLTDFSYDVSGNLTALTYPDGSQEGFTYDAFGNLTSYSTAVGRCSLSPTTPWDDHRPTQRVCDRLHLR